MIWIGTDDGLIQVTHDGGESWKNVTPPALRDRPWSKVSIMDASHFDTLTAYAAVNTFRLDDLRPYIYRTHDGGKTWKAITTGLPDGAIINVVREDPERKGLLFAGSETQVWVSFDDGDHWQSLRLDMPATSIRDLVVHGDDIVVGTHGRSFWILDNITPLRQANARVAASDAFLFEPALAYRVRWNNYTDTPVPQEEPAGENPPDGAMIDYYLLSEPGSAVTLEILDDAGKLVRRYSSADEPLPPLEGTNVPDYWIRPQQMLSAAAGMHRFVWDLHYPPPAALSFRYPISAIYRNTPRVPKGRWAMPGVYTVKLTVDGRSYTRELTLEMDPRVKTPRAALAEQFALATRVTEAMRKDYDVLEGVRALRAQLDTLAERAGKGRLAAAIAELGDKAAQLEGRGGRSRGGGGRTSGLARLNGELSSLLGIIDGADAKPASQATEAVTEAEAILSKLLARWSALRRNDIPDLNTRLAAGDLPAVQIP